jgi:hypothetical protein
MVGNGWKPRACGVARLQGDRPSPVLHGRPRPIFQCALYRRCDQGGDPSPKGDPTWPMISLRPRCLCLAGTAVCGSLDQEPAPGVALQLLAVPRHSEAMTGQCCRCAIHAIAKPAGQAAFVRTMPCDRGAHGRRITRHASQQRGGNPKECPR